MTRNARRIQLAPAYILHHRPYRDTSRIFEVVTRDHGRLSLFARGSARAEGEARLHPPAVSDAAPVLDRPWRSRAAYRRRKRASRAAVPAACLMASFYLNELLMKLTTRHDPLPMLFDTYHETLDSLRNGAPLERELRVFEKRLLEALGYGLDLGAEARDGQAHRGRTSIIISVPSRGSSRSVAAAGGALAGHSLIGLANEQLSSARELDDSRRLLQAALAQCLEGRPLATRVVARAVARRELHTRN